MAKASGTLRLVGSAFGRRTPHGEPKGTIRLVGSALAKAFKPGVSSPAGKLRLVGSVKAVAYPTVVGRAAGAFRLVGSKPLGLAYQPGVTVTGNSTIAYREGWT